MCLACPTLPRVAQSTLVSASVACEPHNPVNEHHRCPSSTDERHSSPQAEQRPERGATSERGRSHRRFMQGSLCHWSASDSVSTAPETRTEVQHRHPNPTATHNDAPHGHPSAFRGVPNRRSGLHSLDRVGVGGEAPSDAPGPAPSRPLHSPLGHRPLPGLDVGPHALGERI